eukprot:6101582-Alexandrium_andersonii.AAC.1
MRAASALGRGTRHLQQGSAEFYGGLVATAAQALPPLRVRQPRSSSRCASCPAHARDGREDAL